jgi:hypothetical protein
MVSWLIPLTGTSAALMKMQCEPWRRLSRTEDRPMMDPGDAPRMFVRRFLGAGACSGPLLAGCLVTWVQAEERLGSL